jgi:hypothetical protein
MLKWRSSPPRGLVLFWLVAVCRILFKKTKVVGERFLNPDGNPHISADA